MRFFFPPFPGAEDKALTPKSIDSSPWFYGESYKPVSPTPSTAKGSVRGASHPAKFTCMLTVIHGSISPSVELLPLEIVELLRGHSAVQLNVSHF